MSVLSEAKHTHGDWGLSKYSVGAELPIDWMNNPTIAVTGDHDVAYIYHGIFNDDGEEEANARLIAAAPDLLLACQKALEHFGDPAEGKVLGLRAAIAKATGAA